MDKTATFTLPPACQRREYCQSTLRRSDLHEDPLHQFDEWFQDATSCSGIAEANAMALSTVGHDLHVTSRMVLLKGYDQHGFCFFTNTTSNKGKQIAENPHVSLLFHWPPLERQVHINGQATLLPRAVTEEYFHSRPRESQLAAWTSHQSAPLANREELEHHLKEVQERYDGKNIPVPDTWNG